jgi:hypothetical protein
LKSAHFAEGQRYGYLACVIPDLAGKCRMSACRPDPQKDRHAISVANMLSTCHLTCRQHGAKTCRRGCRHDTRHVGFSDMSATCRRLHLRMFVIDNFVIDLTIAY